MKNFKRIASAVAAIALAATMAVPMSSMLTASAMIGTGTNSITINATADGATHTSFTAYQIFTVTKNTSNVTVTGWGDGVDVVQFIKDLKADTTIGDAFQSIAEEATPATASKVAEIIGKYTNDTPNARIVAKLAVKNKDATSGTGTTKIENLADGYYVVVDTEAATKGDYEAFTLGMLQLAGGEEAQVTTKIEFPSVVKKVKEDDVTDAKKGQTAEPWGAGFNDVADWDVNTDIDFLIEATLPDNIADYDHYYLFFKDVMDNNFSIPGTFAVSINDTPVAALASAVTVGATAFQGADANDFSLEIMDLFNYTGDTAKSSLAGKKVTVTYKAKLNNSTDAFEGAAEAVIGRNGQQNKVSLEYSNNPNVTGNGESKPTDTGESPEDKVIVFTYEVDNTKKDGVTNLPITGAEFYLKDKTTGKYAKVDENGWFVEWVEKGTATKFVTTDDGKITVKGLDDTDGGLYFLEEVEGWSDGKYNPPAGGGFDIEIKADTLYTQADYASAEAALKALEGKIGGNAATADADTGIVSGDVLNFSGTTLPSTGGIGTTLFYVVGGVLVVGAGVTLITKKRMQKD